MLLKNGALVEARDFDGNTWLHIAKKKNGSFEIIREIFKYGNSVNLRDIHGVQPIVEAIKVKEYNVEVIEELNRNSASLTNLDRYCNSLIHIALYECKSLNVLKELLNFQSDVKIKNGRQETPLFMALSNSKNSLNIIKELIKHGASVSETNVFGDTPLHVAVKCFRCYSVNFKM